MADIDAEHRARELAAKARAVGNPTAWFEELYAAARRGEAVVPWDRETPNQYLVEWATKRQPPGRTAVVIGSGHGRDAEFIASLGFTTTAFDIAPTAVEEAVRRHPDSPVTYVVADLLDPPASWRHAFDLVVESMTVQSLPDPPRAQAIAALADLVGPGGTLIVIALAHYGQPEDAGPPYQLTRAEIEAVTAGGLSPVRVEEITDANGIHRWRAEFTRPA